MCDFQMIKDLVLNRNACVPSRVAARVIRSGAAWLRAPRAVMGGTLHSLTTPIATSAKSRTRAHRRRHLQTWQTLFLSPSPSGKVITPRPKPQAGRHARQSQRGGLIGLIAIGHLASPVPTAQLPQHAVQRGGQFPASRVARHQLQCRHTSASVPSGSPRRPPLRQAFSRQIGAPRTFC